MKRIQILDLILMAFYLALFVVLDYASKFFAFFTMPNGGSLGLGVIALLLASYHLGFTKGTLVAVASVYLQGLMSPFMSQHILDFIVEYIVAFGLYGSACLFPDFGKHKQIKSGIIVTNLVRLAIHTWAGVAYWSVPWWGSLSYNGWYMIPTLLVSLALVPPLLNRIPTKYRRKPILI